MSSDVCGPDSGPFVCGFRLMLPSSNMGTAPAAVGNHAIDTGRTTRRASRTERVRPFTGLWPQGLASTPGETSAPTRPRRVPSLSEARSSSVSSATATPISSRTCWLTSTAARSPDPVHITRFAWEVILS
jgi:hypothetical protein